MESTQTLRTLFDRQLNRPIEKVITYQNRSDAQLRAEVSEYIATDHIEDRFEHLLKLMQAAQEDEGGHEIGVWVSGFYGSGKSSFTKYLGFALDRNMKVGDDSFLLLLQNRLKTASARALFNQVSAVYDPVVIFLDLASEMLAGASMEDISTVLYLKVLQWAGYSEDLKVAEFERMLEKDGKLAELEERAALELGGVPWNEVRNQPLVANPIAARLAPHFYPQLFPTAEHFQNVTLHVNKTEIKRVEEMIDLIRKKSGKKNVVFIVDEVGQYVAAKQNLILNLDGLAKNLKQIGDGKVWLFATAQQTLTEDSPAAMHNAAGLFKLKDRFPIQINLEASDIKEICHKRLLTKSSAGEDRLGKLFDLHGPELRTATGLTNAGRYEIDLDRATFINLYPFLPAHFDILLQLLERLARKTGGLGLRSAIKVLQDVLVEKPAKTVGGDALADREIGTLATTVIFYDSLKRDIQSSFPHIVHGVDQVATRFPNSPLHQQVAKSIAVLQVLENLPVTSNNIAALLHPSVTQSSLKTQVETVVGELLADSMIPLGEKNGSLRFLTQAAVTLQKEFDQIDFRQTDLRAEMNNGLRALFKPLPSTKLCNERTVVAGLRVVVGGGQSASLEGQDHPVQILVEFVPGGSYEKIRAERETESRAKSEQRHILLLGRLDPDAERLAITSLRCAKFIEAHKTASDPDTQEFVRIVTERRERASRELEAKLRQALHGGSFVYHGKHTAVSLLSDDLYEATRVALQEVAAKVFERYSEAPHQADTNLAEKFLKTPLERATANEDPLQVITRQGANARIKTDHKSLVSLRDYLNQNGQVEGRRLLDIFNEPPYGWSKDTTRYLVAALFLAGEIKLRIAGADHVVKNDDTLQALSGNRAFGTIGVSLREERPDPDALVRASDRLRDLIGEPVGLLEDDIAAAAKRWFPVFQQDYAALAAELRAQNLPGAERATDLSSDLTEVVRGDGSDAVSRLGGTESSLADSLKWARKLRTALDNGLRETLGVLLPLKAELSQLPESGIPGELKKAAHPELERITDILARESFFDELAALRTAQQLLEKAVGESVVSLSAQQNEYTAAELATWQALPDWIDLGPEDQEWVVAQVNGLAIDASQDLQGFRRLLAHAYDLNHRLRSLRDEWLARAETKRREKAKAAGEKEEDGGEAQVPVVEHPLMIPRQIEAVADIESLLRTLEEIRSKIHGGQRIRVVVSVQTISQSRDYRYP